MMWEYGGGGEKHCGERRDDGREIWKRSKNTNCTIRNRGGKYTVPVSLTSILWGEGWARG